MAILDNDSTKGLAWMLHGNMRFINNHYLLNKAAPEFFRPHGNTPFGQRKKM